MMRFVTGLALSASIFALAASPALAGTLDQSQTSGSDGGAGVGTAAHQVLGAGTFHAAQTFTAGLSGALDQADLFLARNCASPGDPSVQIRTVSGNPSLPTSTVLATATVPAASVPASTPGWVTVLFPTPATVSAGTRYALVAASGAVCPGSGGFLFTTGYFWGYTVQDLYGGGTRVGSSDGGASWSSGGEDLAFKTYVEPPPPPPDNAPTANAGPDQMVNEGSLVTLDGTGSSDPDGEDLTYAWTTTDTGVTLTDPSSSTPTFTAPDVSADMPLTFTLEVCDEANPVSLQSLCDTDTVVIDVNPLAPPPPDPDPDPSGPGTGTGTGTGSGSGTTTTSTENPLCQVLGTKLKQARTKPAKRKIRGKLRRLGC